MSQLLLSGLVLLLAAPPEGAEPAPKSILVEVPAETDAAVEDERFLLDEAKRLAERGELEEAMVSLDAYATQFAADGKLRYEAIRLDVEVMLRLGRHQTALHELDRAKLEAPEHADLLVSRGELRAGSRRAKEALTDFDAVLAAPKVDGVTLERALSGKAFALLQSGRVREAHDALEAYLERYPEGRFAPLAQKTLRRRPATASPHLPDPMPSVQ